MSIVEARQSHAVAAGDGRELFDIEVGIMRGRQGHAARRSLGEGTDDAMAH